MIDTHIYIIINCDNCGHEEDYEEYDELNIEVAEQKAIKVGKWKYNDNGNLLCKFCTSEIKGDNE